MLKKKMTSVGRGRNVKRMEAKRLSFKAGFRGIIRGVLVIIGFEET